MNTKPKPKKSVKSKKPAKPTKSVKSKASKTRLEYGLKNTFPAGMFTVNGLMKIGAKPQYITAYKRVEAALKAGTIVIVGENQPKKPTRGRRAKLYQLADAKVATLSAPVPAMAVEVEAAETAVIAAGAPTPSLF
jgi:outer membrane murein-binding lipoprotein Lpp